MLANSNDMITNYQILTERFINDNNGSRICLQISIIYGNIVPYWVNYSKLNKGYLVLSNHNHFLNGIYRKYKEEM